MLKLLGKLLLLGVARRCAKRPTAAVETAALVLAALGSRRLGRGPKRDALLQAARVIVLPAAAIKAVRLVRRLAVKRRQDAPPAAAALESASPADPLTAATIPTFRVAPPPLPRPLPRAEWGLVQVPEVAPTYAPWVRCLTNVLAAQGLRSLPPGFDPDGLELTRYLLYGGLLAATKPADAARAVAATAGRVQGTLTWRAAYPFMGEEELKAWEDVAWWVGPDADGTLWLHLHLARAVARCGRGEGVRCGQAVMSQLERGTRALMAAGGAAAAAAAAGGSVSAGASAGGSVDGDGAATAASSVAGTPRRRGRRGEGEGAEASGGGAAAGPGATSSGGGAAGAAAGPGRVDDRIRVLIVGTGSNVRQALRLSPLMREFIRLVQRHYPGRLRAMYLADMPRGLRMGVGAVLNLLSAETRQKIKLCKVLDLPDGISAALAAREEAALAAAAPPPPPAPARGLLAWAAAAARAPPPAASACGHAGPGLDPAAHAAHATHGSVARRAAELVLLRLLPAVLMGLMGMVMAALTYKSLLLRGSA